MRDHQHLTANLTLSARDCIITTHMRIGVRQLCILAFAAAPLAAQHSFTQYDVETGLKLFRANCVVCHGVDGDAIPGTDIGHGKFRHGTTNEELENIIRSGIPGTPMPPNNFTEREAFAIVLYLRQMAEISSDSKIGNGDATRGKSIFEGKGGCTGCHRVNGQGSRTGPDLSDIGSLRRGVELERSILDPDAEVLAQNRYFRAVTKNGTEVNGRLLNEDTFSVQLLDSNERLVNLQKSNLREGAFVEKSPMPSYKGKLNAQELDDLISYLVLLKGFDSK
jgi:putative heme-binding domain-containing protein